ncbi:GATA transcription factor 11 [Forsythia ovata]|uniref:GATA transcription factor 11 n=1 Tax=Forsythia ovata TaxID=205694 RepID=A0ABD1RK11_9LAMI
MNMIEPNSCWDGIVNGATADEEFESILGLLDFPMESLEGDGFVGDWDVSKSQCLGPIPMDTLMELPPNPQGKTRNVLPHSLPKSVAPIDETPEQKQRPEETSSSVILRQHKFAEAKESAVFQTQSPVSVLESSRSCSVGKCVLIKSKRVTFLPWLSVDIVIPVRARSKRVRSSTVNSWLSISPISCASPSSKKALNFGKNKDKRKKKLSQLSVTKETMNDYSQKAKASSMVSDSVEPQNPSLQRVTASKKCTHCEVTKTPQWREGPMGPKTLCNACGVRYRSGRLFPEYRPAASPTFVPSLHSNSHKKVIEMRNKGQHASKVEESLISPPPDFAPMGSYLYRIS